VKNQYIVRCVVADGYERDLLLSDLESKQSFYVHYMECDEYLYEGNLSQKMKENQIIEGDLYIDMAYTHKQQQNDLLFEQNIKESPHITAQGSVQKQLSSDTYLCDFGMDAALIAVTFEDDVILQENDFIAISGILNIEIEP